MLINLSNHPWNEWEEEQKQQALSEFGTVEDMMFPNVPPEATQSKVVKLAEKYVAQVLCYHQPVVHVMGELSFCFSIVTLLQKKGIPCVVSTSERSSVKNLDNSKTQYFQFCQFRYYPNLI